MVGRLPAIGWSQSESDSSADIGRLSVDDDLEHPPPPPPDISGKGVLAIDITQRFLEAAES